MNREGKIRRVVFLAAGEAWETIFWPSSGLTWKTETLVDSVPAEEAGGWGLGGGEGGGKGVNFCVRSTPLQRFSVRNHSVLGQPHGALSKNGTVQVGSTSAVDADEGSEDKVSWQSRNERHMKQHSCRFANRYPPPVPDLRAQPQTPTPIWHRHPITCDATALGRGTGLTWLLVKKCLFSL